MKKGETKSNIFCVFMLTALVLLPADSVLADGWWGYGYRDKEWVLKHGGTIIHFEIENISGESEEYKAVMYDSDGDYVEVEYGKKGLFDDAKNGTYLIKADRGVLDGETYRGGKSFATIKVTAHPGETIKLKFNYKKKKVSMTTDYVKPVPKPIVKPAAVPIPEPVVEIQQETKTPEPIPAQIEEVAIQENKESVADILEEFVHPDAMASESEQQVLIKQGDYSQQINIFVRIWDAVLKFFSFR